MTTSRKLLFASAGLATLAIISWSQFSSTTNCGGNAAALSNVRQITACALALALDGPFQFQSAPPEERESLAQSARSSWLPGAHFLVTRSPVSKTDANSRRLIVVCDTAYRNLPRQIIGSAAPTHAAGFSDGSSELISSAEFAAIDRSKFIPLDELYSK